MNTKTYITLCYLTVYVIAPVLSILMVIGAMTIIRSDNTPIDNTTAIALNVRTAS